MTRPDSSTNSGIASAGRRERHRGDDEVDVDLFAPQGVELLGVAVGLRPGREHLPERLALLRVLDDPPQQAGDRDRDRRGAHLGFAREAPPRRRMHHSNRVPQEPFRRLRRLGGVEELGMRGHEVPEGAEVGGEDGGVGAGLTREGLEKLEAFDESRGARPARGSARSAWRTWRPASARARPGRCSTSTSG